MLTPRRAPLSAAQYDDAVSLLAELLLDAAEGEATGVRSAGVIDSASDGGIGRVIAFPQTGRKGREVA